MADQSHDYSVHGTFDIKPAPSTAASDTSSMYNMFGQPGSAAPPPFATTSYDSIPGFSHALPPSLGTAHLQHDHHDHHDHHVAVSHPDNIPVEEPKPEIAPEADFAVNPVNDSQTPNAALIAATRVTEPEEADEIEEEEYEIDDREDADADWVPDQDGDDEPAPRRSAGRRSGATASSRSTNANVVPSEAQLQAQQQHMLQQAQAQYYLQQQAAQQAAHAAATAQAHAAGLPPPPPPAQMLDPDTLAALQRQLQVQPAGGNIVVGANGQEGVGSTSTPSRKRRTGDVDELEELDSFIDDDEEGGKKKKARKSGVNASGRASNPNPVVCDHMDEVGKLCGTVFQRPYDLARHRETKHGPREAKPDTKCDRCSKSFSRKDALLRHKRQNKCQQEKSSTPRRSTAATNAANAANAAAAQAVAASSAPEPPQPSSSQLGGVDMQSVIGAAAAAHNYAQHPVEAPQEQQQQIAVDPSVANQGDMIDIDAYIQAGQPQQHVAPQLPGTSDLAAHAAHAAHTAHLHPTFLSHPHDGPSPHQQ